MFLVVKEGQEIGRVYKLREGNLIAGRNPSCQIVLSNDTAVSREHFKLTRQPNGICTVTDLSSTNGTLLNNRRLLPNIPTEIQPGVILQVGKTRFELIEIYQTGQARRGSELEEVNTESMLRRSSDTRSVKGDPLIATEFLPELPEIKS